MNMPIEEDFRDAADRATKLPKRPPNDVLLQLYSLYKQGTEGDVSGTRPGFADFEGRAKYDAWNKLQGKTSKKRCRNTSIWFRIWKKKLPDDSIGFSP